MNRRYVILAALVGAAALLFYSRRETVVPRPAPEAIEWQFTYDGQPHLLANGVVYRELPSRDCVFVAQVFDPEAVERQFLTDEGVLYRRGDNGDRYPVLQPFVTSFEDTAEGVAGLRELIGPRLGWTSLTLQTESTPSVPEYVALRTAILRDKADFVDARVEPLAAAAHTGALGLRCTCPPRRGNLICAKASLSTGLVRFRSGDTLWFRGWYRSVGDVLPFTIVDFECDYAEQHPGLRITLGEDGFLDAELKALTKPRFSQPPGTRVPFPRNEWVEVTVAAEFDVQRGRVRIWQNGQPLVDATGETLPFPSCLINDLEVGISAHSYGDKTAVLDVDDIYLGLEPPPDFVATPLPSSR